MHHYPFHVGDYASHTQHLDELEDLAYRRMLDYVYLNEINLPESIDEIARLIRMRTHSERIATVLREFFKLENGEWINKRANIEIDRYQAKSDKAKESASKRWAKADANALPTHTERNANQNQNQNRKPVTSKSKDIVPANAVTKPTTGTRLDPEWQLPKELGNWALEQGLNKQQVILEGEKFRDHWIAQAGAKGRKADWPATWRNWVRNSKSRQPKTFYEITKEQKEADADKRLSAIGNASMAELEEAGLARNGVILGGSTHG